MSATFASTSTLPETAANSPRQTGWALPQVQLKTFEPTRLVVPQPVQAVALIAHGPATNYGRGSTCIAARIMRQLRIATAQVELKARHSLSQPEYAASCRHDLLRAADWMTQQPSTKSLPVAFVAIGHACSHVLHAAAERPQIARAVVLIDGTIPYDTGYPPGLASPLLIMLDSRNAAAIRASLVRQETPGKATQEIAVIPGNLEMPSDPGHVEGIALRAARWILGVFGAADR